MRSLDTLDDMDIIFFLRWCFNRPGKDTNYVEYHSFRVFKAATVQVLPTPSRIAALLHDVLEDGVRTGVKEDIEKLYPDYPYYKETWELVDCLTRRHDEIYYDYIKRVAKNKEATLIKILDLEDNLFGCCRGTCSVQCEGDVSCGKSFDLSLAKRYLKALNSLTRSIYGQEI